MFYYVVRGSEDNLWIVYPRRQWNGSFKAEDNLVTRRRVFDGFLSITSEDTSRDKCEYAILKSSTIACAMDRGVPVHRFGEAS